MDHRRRRGAQDHRRAPLRVRAHDLRSGRRVRNRVPKRHRDPLPHRSIPDAHEHPRRHPNQARRGGDRQRPALPRRHAVRRVHHQQATGTVAIFPGRDGDSRRRGNRVCLGRQRARGDQLPRRQGCQRAQRDVPRGPKDVRRQTVRVRRRQGRRGALGGEARVEADPARMQLHFTRGPEGVRHR